jgi:hypothetical protein
MSGHCNLIGIYTAGNYEQKWIVKLYCSIVKSYFLLATTHGMEAFKEKLLS